MKNIKFTKMHGAGNDYIYVDASIYKIEDPSALAIKLSDRHFGIGSDGLVLILPSKTCDFLMKMFNSDGSEAEMCGNATRCVGKYVFDNRMTDKTEITLETKAGTKYITLLDGNEKTRNVRVDMGEPILEPSLIPVKADKAPVIDLPLVIDGVTHYATCVSMGNPHAVLFMEKDVGELDLISIGPKFEKHELFPRKTNTEFVNVIDRKTLKMRVWERGAGETLACGTGACASTVAAILKGLCERKITMHLVGGTLEIEWNEKTNHVLMTGEAVSVFDGIIL